MLDRRSPEEKKRAGEECYANIRAEGRRSCGGCHLDHYCPMAKETARWLFETFMPAIDPANTLRWK